MKDIIGHGLCLLIRVYQMAISPFLPNCCRFYPSCSAFALEAIQKYGPGKGTVMAAARICRCHPFHEGGYDPVPDVPCGA